MDYPARLLVINAPKENLHDMNMRDSARDQTAKKTKKKRGVGVMWWVHTAPAHSRWRERTDTYTVTENREKTHASHTENRVCLQTRPVNTQTHAHERAPKRTDQK
jgi:hypothetical protein